VILDLFFSPFFWLKWPNKREPRKILVFDAFLIGDNIITTALINSLHKKYGSYAKIYTLTNPYGLMIIPDHLISEKIITKIPWSTHDYSFKNLKNFFSTLLIIRKHQFDLGIETRGDWRSSLFMLIAGIKNRCSPMISGGRSIVNIPVEIDKQPENLWKIREKICQKICGNNSDFIPLIKTNEKDIEYVGEFLKKNSIDEYKVFNPFASQEWRSLSQYEIKKIVEHITDNFEKVIIPAEKSNVQFLENVKNINNCYIFTHTLTSVFELIKRSKLCITVDTFLAHVCGVYKIPLILICHHDGSKYVTPYFTRTDVFIKSENDKNTDHLLKLIENTTIKHYPPGEIR